jgi:aldose sugar dehydrogenase
MIDGAAIQPHMRYCASAYVVEETPMNRFAALCAVSLAACTQGSTAQTTAGQAPITGAQTPSAKPFVEKPVAEFDAPWAMAFLPGRGVPLTGMALVTEQRGRLWLVDTSTGARTAVSGVPKVDYGGQGGLGDVIVHPDFAGNGFIYLSWVEAGTGGVRGAVVGRAKLVLGAGVSRLDDIQVIWRQEPKVSGRGHFGHRLAFGPDGMLYISSGERQKFTPAQDLGQNLGKIVRLTDSGTVPSDNPYYDQGRIKAQIWSHGHRNPLGIAFDAQGRLWEQEMGPEGGDEVNLILRGRNYGYPVVSNGRNYGSSTDDIPDHPTRPEFEAPKVSWNPVISPAGLIVYSGTLFPAWKGNLFIGGLSSQALIRVKIVGDRASEAARYAMGTRIREVEQGPDGALWVLEDGPRGRLIKLTPRA